MIRFVSTAYPALMAMIGERTFKFVGGKLDVLDEDAELIRAFALTREQYQITETDNGEDVVPVAEIDGESAEPAPDENVPNVIADVSVDLAEDVEDDQPNAEPLDGSYEDLTNRQLDVILQEKDLPTRGNHADKVARLSEADEA